MDTSNPFNQTYEHRFKRKFKQWGWQTLHLDPVLILMLLTLCSFGLFILYSASNDNPVVIEKQTVRLGIGFIVMLLTAQIPPRYFYQWAPFIFAVSLFLLVAVLFLGVVQQGSRRWFNLYFMHFQPSEVMKLAMPMMLSWFLSKQELPPKIPILALSCILLILPVLLITKQPDLGTALIVGCSGFAVLLLAGLNWKLVCAFLVAAVASTPLLWHHMHSYQRERVLTFLDPERDPLGSGYHIIQSKIAIGSGGIYGKGWLQGTQSHLSFLPEHTTDFIFAVNGEELGLIGGIALLFIYLAIVARCLYLSVKAQNSFSRLLSGSIALTFVAFAFINIGMVIGLLPVVGVPLPLVSYGGSSMLTFMAGFGFIMSAYTHRKLWSN